MSQPPACTRLLRKLASARTPGDVWELEERVCTLAEPVWDADVLLLLSAAGNALQVMSAKLPRDAERAVAWLRAVMFTARVTIAAQDCINGLARGSLDFATLPEGTVGAASAFLDAMEEATKAATTLLGQPWPALGQQEGPAKRAVVLLSGALLHLPAATTLLHLPAATTSSAISVCSRHGLALAVLSSGAGLDDTHAAGRKLVAMGWVSTIIFAKQPVDSVQGQVAELTLLCAGLQAAAHHQLQAGRSCWIPADPVVAAGLNSSSSDGGGGGGTSSSQQQQPPAPRLAVPALHKALLRQVPCLDLMLQQPSVVEALLDRGVCVNLPHQQAAVQVWNSSLVPVLQVLVELALLAHADNTMFVRDTVSAMLQLIRDCSAPSSSSGQAAGSSSSSTAQCTPPQLQAAQAAGLLAPVLHLLSAAVLHVLGPPATADAVSAAGPLPSDLAGCFAALVAAVLVPVEPKHLAAAICQQPLRSLAALEMTLRLWAAGLVPQLSGAVEADGAPTLLLVAGTVATACSIAAMSGKLETALQSSDSATASLVSNHLCALLATCLKCCSRAAGNSKEGFAAAINVAGDVGQAALGVMRCTGVLRLEVSAGGSGSQTPVSTCGTTHWLFLVGRSLAEYSTQLMQFVAMSVLDNTVGIRARLGLEEGELHLASSAEAAAAIRAAARAATGPGDVPCGDSQEVAAQRWLGAVAAVSGGAGMVTLCGGITRPGQANTGVSVLSEMLRRLCGSLAQLAQRQQQQQQGAACSSSGATSGLHIELLQQLAQAASDVQQQLDGWSAAARCEASRFNTLPLQPCRDHGLHGFTQAVLRGCDGVSVLRDAQGQPMVRQHALLNVLHHAQRLQRLGAAVCAVLPPPSLACANPGCDNVSGLSDMLLVWRRGVCGHCRAARFCSAACLRAHWAAHRDPGSLVEAVVCESVEEKRC